MDVIEIEIKKKLTTLDGPTMKCLIDRLIELGVSDISHLDLIEENDLIPVIKTIQARLLIRSWKNKDKGAQSDTACEVIRTSDDKEELNKKTNADIKSTPCLDWTYDFSIPWKDMPQEVIKSLKEDKRPTPSSRRQVVRIVSDAILKVCKKPGKKALAVIARKMVNKYPLSLADFLCGEVVGEGHSSLLRQMEVRFDNLNRANPFSIMKRLQKNDDGDDCDSKKLQVSDCYGCINWQPSHLPIHETVETQEFKKANMLEISSTNPKTVDKHHLMTLLEETYYSLRKDINGGKSICHLKAEWPMLFSLEGVFHHFKMLVGIDVIERINDSLSSKGARMFSFLKTIPSKKEHHKMKQFLDRLDEPRIEDPDLASLIFLLMMYFGEDVEELFIAVDVTKTADGVENMQLPTTPCLIYYGEDITNATAFMLVIDGKVIIDSILHFNEALGVMFAAYYCFNIHYSKSSFTTLEFIQRCFLGINPNKGSKADPKKRKKEAISTKILTLLNKLSDFEWTT